MQTSVGAMIVFVQHIGEKSDKKYEIIKVEEGLANPLRSFATLSTVALHSG